MKNLNSFNHVCLGLAYEIKRQSQLLLLAKQIRPETRRFDEKTGETILMRVKAGADDYRYFPEPDLPPMHIGDDWMQEVQDNMPEMPA